MPPTLRQSVANAAGSGQSRTVTATFGDATAVGNLIVVIAVASGGTSAALTGPAGFTLIRERTAGNLKLAVWYREGAPATTSVSVTISIDRSLQVRALEYQGAAMANALDKVTVLTNTSSQPTTGTSGNTAQADEIVLAAVANRYASTTQSGFTGGLARLFESTSPSSWGFFGSDSDERRTRLTVHELIANVVKSFSLSALLSSVRDWVGLLITFRGGSSGPVRLSSTLAPAVLSTAEGSGNLIVFGPLASTLAPAVLSTGGGRGEIGPFAYQYVLNGLKVGDGTDYEVVSVQGLEGWEIRSSDDDQPRGDGALRGVDLQSARLVTFTVEVLGDQAQVEQRLDALWRVLVPRRDQDWDLVWRHPSREVRVLRCRPTTLVRELDLSRSLLANQPVALRAADPRHYSWRPVELVVPVTPAGAAPVTVAATNLGNAAAYPVITVTVPVTSPTVTKIELVNVTSNVTFNVTSALPARSTLVGDMHARITGQPRSPVTLDGASKYGAWQLPRDPFRLDPNPAAPAGVSQLYLQTVPAGTPVAATLSYRHTWAG